MHYADAFAGTGSHIPTTHDDGQELLVDHDALEGSVKAALNIDPSFDTYHFNDLNAEHIKLLNEVKSEYPRKEIDITQLNANEFVPRFCQTLSRNDRAVLFVDPYSTQLDWVTLNHVANSKKVDLWLLFPISALIRMTPKSGDRIVSEWRPTLNRMLGTDAWEEALYKTIELPPIDDMFGESSEPNGKERLNTEELGKWVTERLQDIFPYVSEPVPLKNNNRPLFNLYFIVSNPHPKAQALAQRVVKNILKKEH